MRRCECITCGKTKTQFVKRGAAGGNFLNTFVNNLPSEMHFPDKTMLNELNGIVNPTLRERIDKSIVGKLINAKVNFGMDAAIKIKKILKFTDELEKELYKPVTRKFPRRRVNVNGIDEIWDANLIDMQAYSKDNNGLKYLITVIDILLNLFGLFL